MSWPAAARAIAKYWPDRTEAITMLAIAAGESGQFTQLHGDPVSAYPQYAAYSCNGFLSHGILQVFAGVHWGKLVQLSGSANPCDWSRWCEDFDNGARAAKAVWDERAGDRFRAWSVYNAGHHLPHMARATQEIDDALAAPPPEPTPPAPPGHGLVVGVRKLADIYEVIYEDGHLHEVRG